ncbi:MAG: aspartate--tRNA ligase [Parachlamydiales bacterium]|nr:aspartate--tRNA ligase [Parachlamydiales bacterium]
MKRTHTCGEITKNDVGKKVKLSGWINKRRDHGALIFVDIRDRYGITQVLFDPEISALTYENAKPIRNEWVIEIEGEVALRQEGMANSNMVTGDIEIIAESLKIFSKSLPSPFPIFEDKTETNEELRLKFRYLDIRRKPILDKIVMRSKAMQAVRNFLSNENFIEVTTPILCKSTPEGARDYLVPARLYPSNFYALPQSPQLYKQLLMIGGLDRYFQLATCFRDEDPRSDRQPEFTQIDIEMSFADKKDIFSVSENLTKEVFKKCLDIDILTPFPIMSYSDAIEKYGTDKPDLRFDMPLERLDQIAKKSNFSIFLKVLEEGGCVKAITVKNAASDISRKKIDEYTSFVKEFGLMGLVSMKVQGGALTSSISKYFSENELKEIKNICKAEEGDLIFIAAAKPEIVNQSLDHLRRKLAKDRKLIKQNVFEFLWVDNFPLFEKDEEENRLKSMHHPFTSPIEQDLKKLDKDPISVNAAAYDLVLNGYEIAGGSQRIYDKNLQEKIFKLLNLSKEDIFEKFGFFVEAFSYGCPPHLGIAFGFDRLMMLLTNTENMRDVIAFPKTLRGLDLMTQAPSQVSNEQLKELSIKVSEEKKISW